MYRKMMEELRKYINHIIFIVIILLLLIYGHYYGLASNLVKSLWDSITPLTGISINYQNIIAVLTVSLLLHGIEVFLIVLLVIKSYFR